MHDDGPVTGRVNIQFDVGVAERDGMGKGGERVLLGLQTATAMRNRQRCRVIKERVTRELPGALPVLRNRYRPVVIMVQFRRQD